MLVQAGRSIANSSKESGLLVLRLILGLLEELLLFRELRNKSVALFSQLAAVHLLGSKRGVGFAQLSLKNNVGFCKK